MSDESLQPPHVEGFDSFELIGRGGMATVWRARQIALDRPVAIKVLDPEQCKDDEDIDRFQSEARAAARMSHPGIIQVYDAFYRDGRFCFVMELVEGETVGAWIRRAGRLSAEEALFVARGVATALAYAWERQSLVHLDIKPENVMIDASGDVKVMDFGLSRSRASLQSRREDVGDGGYVYGTPAYMPPEQATGEPDLGPQADMYALGATIFHAVSGRRLFSKIPTAEVMDAQVNLQDESLYDLDPSLSPFFCEFVERLLAKRPEDRFSGWDAVLRAIDHLEEGRPVPEGPIPDGAASTLAPSDALEAARQKALAKAPHGPLVVRTVPGSGPGGESPVTQRIRALARAAGTSGSSAASSAAAAAAAAGAAAARGGKTFLDLLRRSDWRPSPVIAACAAAALAVWIAASTAVSGRIEMSRRYGETVRRGLDALAAVPPGQRADPAGAIEWIDGLCSETDFAEHHPDLAQRANKARTDLAAAATLHEALVLYALEAEAAPFAAAGDAASAARGVRRYGGPFAAATRDRREALAARLSQPAPAPSSP